MAFSRAFTARSMQRALNRPLRNAFWGSSSAVGVFPALESRLERNFPADEGVEGTCGLYCERRRACADVRGDDIFALCAASGDELSGLCCNGVRELEGVVGVVYIGLNDCMKWRCERVKSYN